MIRIQLVDDDPRVLHALRRLLRDLPWHCEAFADPAEALEALRDHAYALVLCDLHMPQLDGIEYLSQVRRRQPWAVRLLFSGSSDRQALVRAINLAGVQHFVDKPWQDAELRDLLSRAVERQQKHQSNYRELRSAFARQAQLRRMQRLHPQLLQVPRASDGAIELLSER